jgi:PTS system nitrogen regulatory IIA component
MVCFKKRLGDAMNDEELLTSEQVAKYLKLNPRTVTNMAGRGDLPASKVGRHWRFRKSDVDEYLERKKPKPKE